MYKIVGADQREYGPVTEDQVRDWITEGRANAQTIARFGDGPWKPLSSFPEFAPLFADVSPSSTATPPPTLPLSPVPTGTPPPANGLAIAGLVCGILGLFCCGPLFSTAALVLSIIGLSQINQYPNQYSGKNLALAGIGLALVGYILFALLLFSGIFRRTIEDFGPRF